MLDPKPTAEDVISLYRLLLGREPDDEAIVQDWLTVPNIDLLVNCFLDSPEFKARHALVAGGPSMQQPSTPLVRLKSLVDQIAERYSGEIYQPLYGVALDHPYRVQRDCINRCELVLSHLSGLPIHQMTLTDVGTHMGFMSFYLAEHFANVVGLETDPLLYEFCSCLKEANGSRASFEQLDFFNNYSSISSDVCLLFSVVHYLVGSTTVETAKRTLAEVVSQFDFTIIELSSSRDYPYMPSEPAELLADIKHADIKQIGVSDKNQRPIYLIHRSTPPFGGNEPVEYVWYVKPIGSVSCTRVYLCGDTVLKVLPFNGFSANDEKFHREVAAYRLLEGAPYLPKLVDAGIERSTGWMRLSRLRGRQVNHLYSESPEMDASDKETLICGVIDIVSRMASHGLHWNDLSAHNVMITDEGPKIIDLGEAAEAETHDQIAMLTWFLHDLQIWRPRSYRNGAYARVLKAAGSPDEFTQARFLERSGTFFAPELQWLYDALIGASSLAAVFADEPLMTRIRQAAARPLAFNQREPAQH
jgi:hypothetical protein